MRIVFKLGIVFALSLALLLPLALVREVIADREAYRAEVVAQVERAYAGPQAVAGPVLRVPYSEEVDVDRTDRNGAAVKVRERVQREWLFFPQTLDAAGPLRTRVRSRGIHEVRVFEWDGRVAAGFDLAIPNDALPNAARVIGTPRLSYAISDVRGIRGTPRLRMGGRDVELLEGASDGAGLHARLATPTAGARLRFDATLALTLGGSESLGIVPVAKRNRIALDSSWPHPGFEGVSPWRSTVDPRGFQAEWRLASVATDVQRQMRDGHRARPLTPSRSGVDAAAPPLDSLGVVLTDPVDTYTQADRATKYGLLFVLLTFMGFFLFEVLRGLAIHPFQYALVGLALAIFFLLLVSLSEHLRFGVAYLIAAVACVGLIGVYVSAVLRSAWRGAGFAGALGLLYAALYGLLISEDMALALGAGLLFAVLAAVMLATRHLDWYRAAAQFQR